MRKGAIYTELSANLNYGTEYKYWQDYLHKLWDGWYNPTTGAGVNETAVSFLKNPDVDKDNITDGKEIKGWTVKIIVGYDEENNPISKEVTLYGDPLAAYREPRKEDGELGDYIDSDEDNIPDIVESLLSNNSTFAKFARLFADPTSEYYDLWTSYNWTIAYFFSVRNNRNFHYYLDLLDANKYSAEQIARYITEWNNTPPHNKSCAENATQWLRDEFNPLITESMAPVITEFVVNTKTNGWIVWQTIPNYTAHVVVEIRDVSGISRVRIKSVCPDVFGIMSWTIVKEYDGTQTSIYLDEIIDVTEVSAVLTYNISVNATDTLGNSAEWYKEVNGPFGVVIKTIAKALAMFWDFLCEVGAKIVEGLSILLEWIKGLIQKALDVILSPLRSAYNEWANNIAPILIQLGEVFGVISKRGENNERSSETLKRQAVLMFLTALFAGTFGFLLLALPAIIIGLQYLITIVQYVLPGGQAATIITNIITGIAVGLIHYSPLFEIIFSMLASALIGEIIGTLLTNLIPSDSAFWGGNIASAVVSIGVIIWQYRKAGYALSKMGSPDICGLMLVVVGFFLTGVLYSYGYSLWSSAVGLVLSIIGLIIALVWKSPVDTVNPAIGYIDEIIDAGIVGMNAAEVLACG